MTRTKAGCEPLEELRRELEAFIDLIPPEASPDLPEAVRGVVAAIDYKDDALLRSRFEAMGEAFADTANRAIERAATWLKRAAEISEMVKSIGGTPDKQFDEVGKGCQELFDKLSGALDGIKASWVRLALEMDQEVSRADELESLIRDLAALRQSTMTGWPWSELGLPPVNRKMVAESRAAYARGEGKPIQYWIDQEASKLSK